MDGACGLLTEVCKMEERPGGTYRTSFADFDNWTVHEFGGTFLGVVPNKRLRHTEQSKDPPRPVEIVMQMTRRRVASSTEMTIEQSVHLDARDRKPAAQR
jgi:uncharacterized protein YndB with AHSA1/START domain